MNDLELLRLAAKAAGLTICDEWDCAAQGYGILIGTGAGDLESWNPLDFDGDAFRLAAALKMNVFMAYEQATAEVASDSDECPVSFSRRGKDLLVCARWVIVRTAAAIGEAMP